jgi:hypothetical protein
VCIFALIGRHIMPTVSSNYLQALNLTEEEKNVHFSKILDFQALIAGRPFEHQPPVIKTIDLEKINELKKRFGGDT